MKHYPAKIILFGEHTILRGSRALATVYPQLSGHWVDDPEVDQRQLPAFADYLRDTTAGPELALDAFRKDLSAGLAFDSNIPTGYGLGSSGALTAAVFDRYGSSVAKSWPKERLKALFAEMESFFHGSSSGTDPLICYLQKPVCLLPGGGVEEVQLPPLPEPFRFFLLDTGRPRKTAPLVRYFLDRYEQNPAFWQRTDSEWIASTETAIDAALTGDGPALWQAFDRISRFQLTDLPPMVLPELHPIWEEGLAGDSFRLKICGAGGGGYCLGMAKDWKTTQVALADWPLLEA